MLAGAAARPLLPLLRQVAAFRALASRQLASDPPAPADLIHVLGGGHAGPTVRIDHAIGLFQRGLAPRMLLTGSEWGIDWAERARGRALELGVPASALLLDAGPRSTSQEAACLARLAPEIGARSVILVTEAFHSGRAFRLFSRALAATGVRIVSCPAGPDGFPPPLWWEEPGLRALVLGEAARLAVARAIGSA
jgi:uncharacterized SAM-binding protein YcdF (DUF218 family)